MAPQTIFGTYEETGLDSEFCFDCRARYSPYEFDDGEVERGSMAARSQYLDWTKVAWALLQDDCMIRNMDRYEPIERDHNGTLWMPTPEEIADIDSTIYFPDAGIKAGWFSSSAKFKKRSAAVFSIKDDQEWAIDTMEYIRSMVMELSLHSGAEYEVIFLVEVRDADKAIFTDSETYAKVLRKSVPEEFRSLTILFNHALLDAWYPRTQQRSVSQIR